MCRTFLCPWIWYQGLEWGCWNCLCQSQIICLCLLLLVSSLIEETSSFPTLRIDRRNSFTWLSGDQQTCFCLSRLVMQWIYPITVADVLSGKFTRCKKLWCKFLTTESQWSYQSDPNASFKSWAVNSCPTSWLGARFGWVVNSSWKSMRNWDKWNSLSRLLAFTYTAVSDASWSVHWYSNERKRCF